MKKLICILFVFSFVFILVACGEGTSSEPEEDVELSLEELGEIIVTAGAFWENWWFMRGGFEHTDYEEMIGGNKIRLLPESGFENLNDIRNYLLQYYTENWVDSTMSAEYFVFAEYFNILYMHNIRAGFPRPDWATATHVLVEQNGNRAIVETTVLAGAWQPDLIYSTESLFRFTFVDGRIDDVNRNMIWYNPEEVAESAYLQPTENVVISLEEFGGIIVRAGTFWEKQFAPEHVDPDKTVGNKIRLLPESDFENLNDIRNYLLQYYTENWVDSIMSAEYFTFAEHFGILYMVGGNGSFVRPDWTTAEHMLIEQAGNHAIVETTVLVAGWHRAPYMDVNPSENVYRFTFVDSRIEHVSRNMIFSPSPYN